LCRFPFLATHLISGQKKSVFAEMLLLTLPPKRSNLAFYLISVIMLKDTTDDKSLTF
jgi:hypothetical protein